MKCAASNFDLFFSQQVFDSAHHFVGGFIRKEKVCADFDLSRKEFPPKEKIASFYSYCRNCSITLEELMS